MTTAANRFPWRVAAATACAWMLLVGVLEMRNPRLGPSWHGFLHGAIVTRFPSESLPPENPFYAGEPLPYYWAYHWLGAAVSRVMGLDAIASLQVLAFAALAGLVVLAVDVGRRVTGSAAAGVLVGFLALAGANPLGPLIAAGRAMFRGEALMTAAVVPTDTVFVGDAAADAMMSRPLLGLLYLGGDWRTGQNVAWFWDISSRAPALAALMLLAWAIVRGGRPVPTALAALLLTALNPIVGIAATAGIAASLVLQDLAARRSGGRSLAASLATCGALAAGVLLALPTYFHLFRYGGAGTVAPFTWMLLKAAHRALDYGLLAALALRASACAPEADRRAVRALTGAGLAVLGLAVGVDLAEGNDHNLANAAAVLLAVPAALCAWYGRPEDGPRPARRAARIALVVALVHVPMTVGTLVAFDGRPPLPMSHGARLVRTPDDEPVARVEDWIRRETPREAVLVSDPDRPIKMSGNVSELPAFTGRTLLVDKPDYLVRPHRGFEARLELARAVVAGEEPSAEGRQILRNLGRPLFVVTTDPARRAALDARHGPPLFTAGFAAVHRLTP